MEPIGEIGFFSGATRTATIIAARDSVVLKLDRGSFDSVARQVPAIYQTLLRALALRLAASSARVTSEQRAAIARTIAVIADGNEPIPQTFYDRLDNVVGRGGKGRLLKYDYVRRQFPGRTLDDPEVSNWLNAIEQEYELIAYLADDTLTDWTRKAIRQADQVRACRSTMTSRKRWPTTRRCACRVPHMCSHWQPTTRFVSICRMVLSRSRVTPRWRPAAPIGRSRRWNGFTATIRQQQSKPEVSGYRPQPSLSHSSVGSTFICPLWVQTENYSA